MGCFFFMCYNVSYKIIEIFLYVCIGESTLTNKATGFTSGYAADLITEGSISIPYMLLRCYSQLGITETELVLLLHIMAFKQTKADPYPLPEKIANRMSIDVLAVKSAIASLIEKKVLSVERIFEPRLGEWINVFAFDKLFDKLAELWAFEKASTLENTNNNSDKTLGKLYQAFEKEFGRLLTPMESSQIAEWYRGENYSPELILEALKRAVLRGVYNFKYIDSILRDWSRNKISTAKQANEYERNFQKQRWNDNQKQNIDHELQKTSKKDKYKDLYLS